MPELIDSTGDRILWGGYDPAKGVDPAAYSLTEFSPVVWTKLYLSSFTFPGAYTVRQDGRFQVLEIQARFRDQLDPGDYPYPFWHSEKKWNAYVNTAALLLVFEKNELIAAYRKADAAANPPAARKWDGRWQWTDQSGQQQPRVALFSYLLSKDNPHAPTLDSAYRNLESAFRSQNCISCHAPDNPAKCDRLLLLDYPNQSLAARHSLIAILRGNKMPPDDPKSGRPAGIHDDAVLTDLIGLAEAFEKEADAALGYEAGKARQNRTADKSPTP